MPCGALPVRVHVERHGRQHSRWRSRSRSGSCVQHISTSALASSDVNPMSASSKSCATTSLIIGWMVRTFLIAALSCYINASTSLNAWKYLGECCSKLSMAIAAASPPYSAPTTITEK